MKIKSLSVIMVIFVILSVFSGCKKSNAPKNDEKNADTAATLSDASPSSDAASPSSDAASPNVSADDTPTKYGDAEVYINDAGNRAAKTESGEEVEFTAENLEDLMAEYEKVMGTGSAEEKAILDKIQLFLEANAN